MPDEPEFHLFALDVDEAAFDIFDGKGNEKVATWKPSSGLREREKTSS